MKKSFARGLIVGKFAPLHYGHERLIRAALSCCDHTFVLSYSLPELPGCDAARRKRWLESRFPTAQVMVVTPGDIEIWRRAGKAIDPMPPNDAPAEDHRRFVAQLCLAVGGGAVQAVFTGEDYGDAFAASLASFFATPVAHVRLERTNDPRGGSGTRIRAGLDDNRHLLAPEVHADLIRRVCFLGGESSGKSTLCAALGQRFGTEHVPEYGRTLWEKNGGVLTYPDLLAIAREQVRQETEATMRAHRFLFCDTSPLTTLFYCLHMFGRAEPELFDLAMRPYDVTVLCAPDFAFVQDGTRQGQDFRALQHQWYVSTLERLRIPCILATGRPEQRIEALARALDTGHRPLQSG